MNSKYVGLLALLVAVMCWGPAPVITKLGLSEIPEMSFAFLGRFIALIILSVLFYLRGYFKVKKEDLPMFIAAGLTGSVLNVGLFVYGIKLTSAMDAQTIFSTVPITTAIFAYIFLKEKIKKIQILGVVVGFIGTATIAARSFFETGSLQLGNLQGDLLIFMAATSWVAYIMISRKLSKKYHPITITCYSFLVSSIVFAPAALLEGSFGSFEWISNLTHVGIFAILYQGIAASVVAFLAYQVGIKLTSAFSSGVILYLTPIITTIVAVPVLGEKITPTFVIGTAFIIVGSLVATQHEMIRGRLRKKILLD